jgi:Tat protein secretion system quality control protein TatD with DNase activity
LRGRRPPTNAFFDTHAHLDYPDYAPDLPEVSKSRARKPPASTKIISIGTSLDSSERAIRLAEKFPENVYAAVGWHPTEALTRRKICALPCANLRNIQKSSPSAKPVWIITTAERETGIHRRR